MTIKTSAQQLASDLSGVPGYLRGEWEGLSHYEKIEVIRQAGGLPAPQNVLLLGELFQHLESPVFQAQILSTVVLPGSEGQAPEFLEAALRSTNSRIRANAIEALSGLAGERLRASVEPLLADEDNRVRANACIYLWAYEDTRGAVKSALEEMAGSSDPWTRASAVFAAGKLLDPALDPILEAALDDDYEPGVVAAVRGLVHRKYPHLVRRVAAFLADPRRGTALWHAAAEALEKLSGAGPDVEDALLQALGSTGDRELQDKLLAVLARQESPTVAGKVLDYVERLDAGEYHLCQRLLDVIGRQGLPEHRARLEAMAAGKLALYADLVAKAVKEISRRHRRWWSL